jgi:hypothetical protein
MDRNRLRHPVQCLWRLVGSTNTEERHSSDGWSVSQSRVIAAFSVSLPGWSRREPRSLISGSIGTVCDRQLTIESAAFWSERWT